jgi:hypothetical protein
MGRFLGNREMGALKRCVAMATERCEALKRRVTTEIWVFYSTVYCRLFKLLIIHNDGV